MEQHIKLQQQAGFTQGTVPVDAASVNTEGGFSCITYTGTGSAGTVGHGLGKAPQFIITKRTNTITENLVYLP